MPDAPSQPLGPRKLLAPREDSRPLGARAARPLPARHSAGVIAFAALARVVPKSGRAPAPPGHAARINWVAGASPRCVLRGEEAAITDLNSEARHFSAPQRAAKVPPAREGGMITRADDYPIHQTADPVAVAGAGARNFYDRYFFNGYARDGSVFFAVAMGQYPNRAVADAAFNVVHRGRQHIVRASRISGGERMDSQVGPIAVEVLEPLRTLRVTVQPNPWDISADLVFTARAGVIEEPRFHREFDGHVFMDSTRLTQHVEVRGRICVGGETIEVTPERYWGSRDRSWGIRPVGERDADTPAPPPQFFWLWSPVHFDDLCTHFDVNEGADGSRWHQAGMIVPVGGEPEIAASVDHRLEFQPGARFARRA